MFQSQFQSQFRSLLLAVHSLLDFQFQSQFRSLLLAVPLFWIFRMSSISNMCMKNYTRALAAVEQAPAGRLADAMKFAKKCADKVLKHYIIILATVDEVLAAVVLRSLIQDRDPLQKHHHFSLAGSLSQDERHTLQDVAEINDLQLR
ncbi:hypothetical protein LINGRAHAP2_LOCUS22550 [Linum grandiflorum]